MRRGPGVAFGIGAVVLGVAAGVVLWLLAEQRFESAVDGLARAPVGCETVLVFDQPGEFLLFAETEGQFEDVSGNCDASGSFEASDPTPQVNVDIVDPSGSSLEVAAAGGADYDRGGSTGMQVGTVVVAEAGDHVVRVTSNDGEFALAVGPDPIAGVFALRAGALAALVAGLVTGLVLIVLSGRPGPESDLGEPAIAWERPVDAGWFENAPPIATAPPQRPPVVPVIPGQPSGPGWGDRATPTTPAGEPETGSPWGPPRV